MNVKKYPLFFLLLLEAVPCLCQWHFKGQKGFELNESKSDVGYVLDFGYSKYLTDQIYYKGTFFYEYGHPYQTTYNNYGINGLIFFSPLNINYDVFLNLAGGLTANYEYILGLDYPQKSSLNVGAKFGFEGEFFINERIAFISHAYQNILFYQKLGNQRWDYGIGIKFLLN